MDNLSELNYGGGNYCTTLMEEAEDRLMSKVNREVECGFVYGSDLNGGWGYESFKEAKSTWDWRRIPYGSLWRIAGETYRLSNCFNRNVPVFTFLEE